LQIPSQECRTWRIRHQIHHLRQVDEHQPAAVHEQVERRQVTVRQALAGQDQQGVDELGPQRAKGRLAIARISRERRTRRPSR
jgi:hypothetical protein